MGDADKLRSGALWGTDPDLDAEQSRDLGARGLQIHTRIHLRGGVPWIWGVWVRAHHMAGNGGPACDGEAGGIGGKQHLQLWRGIQTTIPAT